MNVLLLFWFALFAGISYVQAGDDRYIPVEHEDDDDWSVDHMQVLKDHNRELDRNRTLTWAEWEKNNEKNREKVKNILENQDKKPETRLYTKAIGVVIAVLVIGGLSACFRRMCKKKPRTVNAYSEETVPALSPESNHFQQAPHAPQSSPYPPQQVPYPEQPNSYLKQPSPYPPQPTPYPQQPNSYLQQPNPYFPQPNPYPQQPSPYAPPQNTFIYPAERTTYPPPEAGAIPLTKT